MTTSRRRFLGRAIGLSAAAASRPAAGEGDGAGAPSAGHVARALSALSEVLPAERRSALQLPFAAEERFDWAFVPGARGGVSFGEMDEAALERAHAVLRAGLSPDGYRKVTGIVSLEDVLREIEGRPHRDRRRYHFRAFGEPGGSQPWGWSFEGHHVSLNFTVVEGIIASTPAFLGANPALVRHGRLAGTRILAAEEDLARSLLAALDPQQRRTAVVSETAPSDILTGNTRRAVPQSPAGLAAERLSGAQVELLVRLLGEHARCMPADVASRRLDNVRRGGIGRVHFAWAGDTDRGQPHYYRLQGPGFLVEYDNTQNGANHVHTVWRELDGDFGRDLLAEHHASAHRS